MRITIATGPLLPVPALLGGAIPRMWPGLAAEFVRHGHEVCFVARSFSGQADRETVNGVRYVRFGGFPQSRSIVFDLIRDFGYALAAVGRLPEADILVTNDFWLPVFAGWFRPRAGQIVINANRFPKGQYRLYSGAALIAAASVAVREAIESQTPALKDRIRVFPNPVDTRILRPDGARPSTGPRTLLFVGRLHPEKGVHMLAEAFHQLAQRHPGWRLRIVGPWKAEQGGGGEAYAARLRELLGDAPAHFAGPQFDPVALAGEFRAAGLFCFPSLAEQGESFGLAALEAMACGVPPVVSALECFRDFVRDNETGWMFNHRSADPVGSLAAVLDRAMADDARLAEIGNRALASAQSFGYAAVAERYLAEFSALLEGRTGNA